MTGHAFTLDGPDNADPLLSKIDTAAARVEKALLDGYRRLLDASYAQSSQWCRLPESMAEHFRRLVKRLQQGLFASTHDARHLRVVSDHHEELRIRLMMLEHLIDREVPWAYLERALNCVLEKVVLLDRNAVASTLASSAVLEGGVPQVRVHTTRESWWRRLFSRGKRGPEARGSIRPKLAVRISEGARRRFERLPEYLKRLSLIYHFMEVDDLKLLGAVRCVPSLGRYFSLQGTVAVFEAKDLGGCHWGQRHKREAFDAVARSVDELQEKLRKRGYQFSGESEPGTG